MKIYFKIVLIAFIFTLSTSSSFAQITINNTGYTPTQLVNGVLVPSSSGTTISNVVFRGVYNNSNRYQVGYFSTATTTLAQLGFTNGVVLSTGNTATIPLALGTNPRASQMATSYSSGTSGELRQTGSPAPIIIQDLDVLAGASNYFNGAILEFDFVPVENSVSFRYIFGSEEYSDNSGTINYQCSNYNDKFGFLISGPGITGGQGFSNNARNIARLANGSEVSINSVNSGVVGASGGAPSAATCLAANSSWVQNSPTPEYLGTIDGTQLNGNTRILTASQTGLIPGQTYHIKLIITDVGDATYDSVVYLEAGSFTTESVCNAGPNQSLCAATSTTLAASSPATGTWSLVSGTGTFVSNTNPNTVVNGLSVGTNVFRWTATDLSCTSDVTVTVTAAPTAPTLACYQTATFNSATCTWNVTGTQPVQPTTACYQTATFNTTTCAWVLTGTQPTQPTTACYQTATFNTTTCAWVLTGTQPTQPTTACYQTATFNTTTCAWVLTGTQPTQPTATNCWDNYQFNTTTCAWVNNGTQPTQPTATNCWDNYQFNNTTCAWVNNGTQPVQPTATNCWDNYQFNNTTCAWVNNGTQPTQPTATNCWDNYQFNTTTCAWVNNGTQPTQPTATNCWDNYQFNTTTCVWVNNGTQPVQPTATNCWDNYQFNNTTCAWVNNGTQPVQPTTACYQTATFNTTTCAWVLTGTQPVQPTTACYQTATFNTTTCVWDITGTQPVQPTATNCWDNYQFNNTTCAWVNNGTQPTQPTATNCWDNYQFNNTTCAWVNNGTQPTQPTATNCWDNYQFNNTTCAWVNNGTQPTQPTATNCWDNYQFNTTTCAWVNNGTQPTQPTATNCWDNYQFNTTSCTWVNNGTQPVAPTASAQSFCTSANATVANLAPSGTGIQWYATATGGTALASTTVLTSTTYYVSQIINGCESARTSVTVSLNNNSPLLIVSNAVCNGASYNVQFNSNGTVTTSAGTVNGTTISGIAVGTNVVVTATSSTGCIATTTMTVASPTNCTNPPTNCITPTLSAGQGTCTGTGTYNFAFNASAGAVVTASSGTISGNTVTGITVGTNVTLTATSGSCVTSLIVNSPADCSAPCSTPTASFSAGVCNGTTYSINFTNPNNATISATAGNVNTTTISAIPVGTNTTITVQIAGCSTQILTITSPQLGVTPFAGNDGNLTLCGSTTPTNTQLFAALGGTPQTGGTWTNSGNTYTYTVIANSDCSSIPLDTAVVTITQTVINTFEIEGQCNGVNYELIVTPIQADVVYNWYNSSDILIGTGASIVVDTIDNYKVEGKISICSESKLINVDDVNCMIPKGVSPNNDGLNDTWDLSNLNVEKAQIFNRYGMEMYAKQNYVDEWDGKSNQGHELPSATYYYVVTFKNGSAKTGWVYLNREK
jgi:gliding motility-associated-like protein